MALTNEQIRSLAEIGVNLLELQLSLAEKTPSEAFYNIWVIGYCYGAFEAMARNGRMDTVETAALITVGFRELLLEGGDGTKRYEQAYQIQTDPEFLEGRAYGLDDFRLFLTERDFRPLMLMNYFEFGKPNPLEK